MGESRVRVDGDDETQRKEYDPWSTSEKETRRRHATGYLNLNSRLRHVQNMMGSNMQQTDFGKSGVRAPHRQNLSFRARAIFTLAVNL